jgi:hypothetical protein
MNNAVENTIEFSKYSPAADIVVASVCLVMLVLVLFSYISRTRRFKLFVSMVILVLAAAWTDMLFYTFAVMPSRSPQIFANWLRCANHISLLLIFVHYVAYICEATHYRKQRLFLLTANLIFAAAAMVDIFVTARGLTFVSYEGEISFERGVFIYAYLAYIILSVVLLINVRKLLFRRIMLGF